MAAKIKIVRMDLDGAGVTYAELLEKAIGQDGAIDPRKILARSGRIVTDNGWKHDVLEGPCECGAWHAVEDWDFGGLPGGLPDSLLPRK